MGARLMVTWTAQSDGQLIVKFASPEDLVGYVNAVIYPQAVAFGYKVTIELLPKDDVKVLRA